jgi:hypothetical protein
MATDCSGIYCIFFSTNGNASEIGWVKERDSQERVD